MLVRLESRHQCHWLLADAAEEPEVVVARAEQHRGTFTRLWNPIMHFHLLAFELASLAWLILPFDLLETFKG